MSKEFVDHHIAGASNVSLVLGEWPVFALNCSYKKAINDAFSIASDNVQDECAIVGLRLSPMREAVHWLGNLVGFELTFQGGLECFKQEVGKSGWKFEDGIAVFPNLESARFCLPMCDTDSHRFLITDILFARRYSLATRTRLLLWVYRFLVTLLPGPNFLYRAVYVRIRRV